MWRRWYLARRLIQALLVLAFLIAPVTAMLGAAAGATGISGGALYVPNLSGGSAAVPGAPDLSQSVELIIGYADPVYAAAVDAPNNPNALDATLASYGAQVVATLPQIQAQVVALPSEHVKEVTALLQSHPGVAYVEPNYEAAGQFTPNDPLFAQYQYSPRLMEAEGAWAITQGDASVLVAIIDSGAAFDHPDLQGKLVAGWNYVADNNHPADDHGHGTHVAGIIAAGFNNGIGVAGVGGNTRVLVYKVLDERNIGAYSNIAAAIIAAADAGAHIINLSLGGAFDSATLENAVNYAWEQGVLIVAAAGNNSSSEPFYPAAYPRVMAVSMTNSQDDFVSLSNSGDWISLAAPGWAIRSTDWNGAQGDYGIRSGTSMAAPHVAGVAALALAVADLSNQELRAVLESSADDLGVTGFDSRFGHGRVNAQRAVQAALNLRQPPAPNPTPQPMPTPTNPPAPTLAPTLTPVPQNEPAPTPVPIDDRVEPARFVRVGALYGVASEWGEDWRAQVTVQMVDENGTGVDSALIHGNWLGGFSGAASCVTDRAGVCTIDSGRIWRNYTAVDFGITEVEHPALAYDESGAAWVEVARP